MQDADLEAESPPHLVYHALYIRTRYCILFVIEHVYMLYNILYGTQRLEMALRVVEGRRLLLLAVLGLDLKWRS